jgi:lipid-A-disaccharide synthase
MKKEKLRYDQIIKLKFTRILNNIFIIATEASGDVLGAGLIKHLKKKKSNLNFIGIGGQQMIDQGLLPITHIKNISVMGFKEVIGKFFFLLRIIKKIEYEIECHQPIALVTIDGPAFCFVLAKKIRKKMGSKIKIIHYVSPSVWAWKKKRIQKMSKIFDHLMVLFPFEQDCYKNVSLPTTFVGHPMVERLMPSKHQQETWKKFHHIDPFQRMVAILPGSRFQEIKYHLNIFIETINTLTLDNIIIVIPTLDFLYDEVESQCKKNLKKPYIIVCEHLLKEVALSCCDVAIAASGTVTLELARLGVPTIVAYRLSSISYWIAKKFIQIPFVSLINILLNKSVVVELIQDHCNVDILKRHLVDILNNKNDQSSMRCHFKEVMQLITPHQEIPSNIAASTVLEVIEKKE